MRFQLEFITNAPAKLYTIIVILPLYYVARYRKGVVLRGERSGVGWLARM
jgi:hypothetical protein